MVRGEFRDSDENASWTFYQADVRLLCGVAERKGAAI